MNTYFVYDNHEFANHIAYISEIFFATLRLKYSVYEAKEFKARKINNTDLVIYYGNSSNRPQGACKEIWIFPSQFFGEHYLSPHSFPKLPLDYLEFYMEKLPILYGALDQPPGQELYLSEQKQISITKIQSESEERIITNFDFFASSFFMLTRYEEMVSTVRDKFLRFPAEESIAYRGNFLDIPVVNAYINLFGHLINLVLGEGEGRVSAKPLYPDNKEFALCLTHDIDNLHKNLLYELKDILYSQVPRKLHHVMDLLKKPFKKRDLSWTLDYVMNLELKYDFKPSFYFMAEGKRYSLKAFNFLNVIEKIKDCGFEIGLHPGLKTSKDRKKIYTLLNNLICSTTYHVQGVRQHYLQLDIPETWEIFSETSLVYDTSLGFAGHEGFRAGYCLPYQPFNLRTNKKMPLWEIPLTVMDATLKGYRKLTPEESLQKVKTLLTIVKKYGGIFVFLWHPDTLSDPRWQGWEGFFQDCLGLFKESNPWNATCCQVVSWFKEEGRYQDVSDH